MDPIRICEPLPRNDTLPLHDKAETVVDGKSQVYCVREYEPLAKYNRDAVMFPETVSADIPLNDDVDIELALIVVAFIFVVFIVLIFALYHL